MNRVSKVTNKLIAMAFALFCSSATYAGYSAINLGSLGGTGNAAYGINDLGQVVGTSRIINQAANHAFLWSNGVMIDLGTIDGRQNSSAVAINNSGVIVGNSGDSGFVYQNGVMTRVLGNGLNTVELSGINNSNIIVGSAMSADAVTTAGVWQNGQLQSLGFLPSGYPGANGSNGLAINDAGQVVGYSYGPNTIPFLYESGAINRIGPPWQFAFHYNFANGINNKGTIIGSVSDFWQGSSYSFILRNGVFDFIDGAVLDINDSDQIVGENSLGGFLWDNGEYTYLSALADVIQADWTNFRPFAINNQGQIAGAAYMLGEHDYFAALLSPMHEVPEPSVLVMVLPALLLLIGQSQRRSRCDLQSEASLSS